MPIKHETQRKERLKNKNRPYNKAYFFAARGFEIAPLGALFSEFLVFGIF